MKKIFSLCMILMMSLLFALTAFAYDDVYAEGEGPGAIGWTQRGGSSWYYNAGGRYLTAESAQIGAHTYHFDISGEMQTGWVIVDGYYRYYAETSTAGHPKGSLYVGTVTPDGYYVDANGNWGDRVDMVFGPAGTGSAEAGSGTATEQQAEQSAQVKTNIYGHSCIEIDITNQMVYAWKGSELVLATPTVTGYKGVHNTRIGDFKINSKETDRYLRGYNDNGTKYASWVNFWMPFNGGQGLHDSSWRGTSHANYGGNIYTYDGSHGCVNLPYDSAKIIFEHAYVGMPVHVHD